MIVGARRYPGADDALAPSPAGSAGRHGPIWPLHAEERQLCLSTLGGSTLQVVSSEPSPRDSEVRCAQCGREIEAGSGVGTGVRSEGVFCDLGCFSQRYGAQIRARHAESTPPTQTN